MLRALVPILSIAVYVGAAWLFFRRSEAVAFGRWPPDPTARRLWIVWLVFLFALAPLTFHAGDMQVWIGAMESAVTASPFPAGYVYLPVYAQVLGALLLPFQLVGAATPLTHLYVVHLPILVSYLYCAKLMAEWIPRRAGVAPLAIVLGPVTIFFVFFGTNHIVMLACLLGALHLLRRGRLFGAGVLAGLGCFKFLLIPTVLVLAAITARTAGWKRCGLFVAGGLASLLPSALYYLSEPDYLWRTLRSTGGMGAHSHHIEPFHAFYLIRSLGGFESWYVGNRVWLYVAVAGALLCILLHLRGRLNALQALGTSAGIVALFSVEPFRLDPTLGLLWMDAVDRQDARSQTAVLAVSFTHAAAWFHPAHSRFLDFYDPAIPLLHMNGAAVGIALACLLLVTLRAGARAGRAKSGPGEAAL
jgi:hypothetical protein